MAHHLVLIFEKTLFMSQAFVRESEEQWLHDVAPSLAALIVYLSRENNNIRVYEKKNYISITDNKNLHEMSNGLTYTKDNDGKWYVFM